VAGGKRSFCAPEAAVGPTETRRIVEHTNWLPYTARVTDTDLDYRGPAGAVIVTRNANSFTAAAGRDSFVQFVTN